MNNMNKIITGALVILLLLVSGLYFKGGSNLLGGGTRMINGLSTDSTSPSAGEVRTTTLTVTGAASISGNETLTGTLTQTGATTTVNGVAIYRASATSFQASTTLCALKGPNATSTLRTGSGVRIASSSATATFLEIGKSVSPYATTTSLGITNVGADVQATILATTTPVAMNDDKIVFTPNAYLVVKVANAAYLQLGGDCMGEWMVN